MEGAAHANQRQAVAASPGRSRTVESLPSLVAGKEVVGRKLAIWKSRMGEWVHGKVVEFNGATAQHKVRYEERGAREEEWLCLAKCRFSWQSDLPPGSHPNPTFVPGLTPSGHEAVEHKVKVFWPGMGKWYAGKVSAYDGRTSKHTILYKDGDVQKLVLRHEAIVWPDVPGLDGPGLAARLAGEAADAPEGVRGVSPRRLQIVERQGVGRKAAADAEQGSSSTGARKLEHIKRENGGEQQGPLSKRARRLRNDVAKPADSNCSDALSQDFSQQHGGDHHSGRSARTGAGQSHPSASPSAGFVSTEPAATHFTNGTRQPGGSGEANQASGSAAGDPDKGVNGGRATPATSSSAADVEVDVVGQPVHAQSGFHQGSNALQREKGGASGQQQPSASGSTAQPTAATDLLSAQGQGFQGQQRGGGRGCGRGGRGRGRGRGRGGRGRAGATSPRDGQPDLTHALEAVVGCRVGVWWADDEAFYKGEVLAFDSYHKRNKILYDDGEEEWVALQRELFCWLTPRALAAGATPELACAMRLLGASNAGAAVAAPQPAKAVSPSAVAVPPPQAPDQAAGVTATQTPAVPSAEAAAAAAAAPSAADLGSPAPVQGPAAVGWRMALQFEGDGTVHRGEILAYKSETGQHQVFYEDGEDEWVDLAAQKVKSWQAPARGLVTAPGLPEGTALPKGRAAIGWRIGVYWRDDAVFYPAEIIGFDTGTGRHQVLYDDGEEEMVSLTTEKVKWMLPPGVRGTADSSDEDSEEDSEEDSSEEEDERPLRRSYRRRGRGRGRPGPGKRRSGRRLQRSPSYEPSERRMRLDGPHCHQPTRFGPGHTPPVSPTFARRATAHGSLCLYPEDTPDGVIPQTFVTPAPPIVVPLRGREARGEPTIARDVSADRGVRLHDGSRLRVTRVNIFLSEDGGNTAKDAAAPESVAAVGVNASALGQQQENGCGIVDAAAAASTTATAAQNKACELRDVLARVATAEACIAQHASEDEARLLEVSEDVTIRQADARILGTQQPQASCADNSPAAGAAANEMAGKVGTAAFSFPATPSTAGQDSLATPAAALLPENGSTAPGAFETCAASAAPVATISAPALWGKLVGPQSPFGFPLHQNGPQQPLQSTRLSNGGSHAAMAAEGTGVLPADKPLKAAQPGGGSVPMEIDAVGDRTVPDVHCYTNGDMNGHLPVDVTGQLELPNGHKPEPLRTVAADGGGAAVAAVTKSGSFGIPETPSLGGELRGSFTLPQRLDSIQMQGKSGSGAAMCDAAARDPPRTCHPEMEAVRDGLTVAQ